MYYDKPIDFSIHNGMLPNVLIFGNGLIHNKNNGGWSDVICKIAGCDKQQSIENAPYTLIATLQLPKDDKERHNKYDMYFNENKVSGYEYGSYPVLEQLLKLPFNVVLSTNFTYEAENVFSPGFNLLKSATKSKYQYFTKKETDRNKDRFGLCKYYKFSDNSPAVFHIHGETRNTSSMVFTHDEYSRFLAAVVEYNKQLGKKYYDYADSFHFESWIDYLLLGNVYIVGLGFDFSEFDLWWLLNRRNREKLVQTGKVYFYCPENESSKDNKYREKISALEMLGVSVEHCNVDFSSLDLSESEKYSLFYKLAIEDINSKLNNGD